MSVLALDLDGTVSAAPAIFSAIGKSMIKAGHEVIILTGALHSFPESLRTNDGRQSQLKHLGLDKGIHYSEIIICEGATGHEVAEQKAAICALRGIGLMIDNEPLFVEYISKNTPCALFKNKKED